MANQNETRVLSRRGARTLTAEEVNIVIGAVHVPTQSVCTFDVRIAGPDNDTEGC
jgi:hypothetical protein